MTQLAMETYKIIIDLNYELVNQLSEGLGAYISIDMLMGGEPDFNDGDDFIHSVVVDVDATNPREALQKAIAGIPQSVKLTMLNAESKGDYYEQEVGEFRFREYEVNFLCEYKEERYYDLVEEFNHGQY